LSKIIVIMAIPVRFCLLVALLCATAFTVCAQDTTIVQTFTFDDPSPSGWNAPYRGTFEFPDGSQSYQKVLMYHTLKCDPATAQDGFNCGEWDYTTQTYVTNYDGVMDSAYRTQVNYTVDYTTPDEAAYTTSPTYTTYTQSQNYVLVNDVITENLFTVGDVTSTTSNNYPLANHERATRTQYLWTAEELTAAGVVAGNINGVHLDVTDMGSGSMRALTIRMKQTTKTALTSDDYESVEGTFSGWIDVFEQDVTVDNTGLMPLLFTTPFNWNGSLNVVVEVSHNNQADTGEAIAVRTETAGFDAGVHSATTQGYLNFSGADYVRIPVEGGVGGLSDQISVSFWAYGDPEHQPQNNYNFEGRDANGNRVVNTHLPWSNGRVYWDCGNSGTGSYDRIEKDAAFDDYAGGWTHWAFTKDATTGNMYIYKNGVQWFNGGGKTRTMEGITDFVIGTGVNRIAASNNNYDGFMREFRIWNTALDEATIAEWMYKSVDENHPNYANLIGYYAFNETDGLIASDSSPLANDGELIGYPQWGHVNGQQMNFDMIGTNLRPVIVFDQSEYDSTIATQTVSYQIENDVQLFTLFENDAPSHIIPDDAPNHPTIATDQFYAWPANTYTYTINVSDNAVLDSVYIEPVNTLVRNDHEYYSNRVTWEIGRFITPYGINLDLGPEGTRWVFDVTDYAPILQGTIDIQAGNNQELLDLKFVFIHGTPARKVVGIKNLWTGNPSYSSLISDDNGSAIAVVMPQEASMFRIKHRASGHGFGDSPENCAEFCEKVHSITVNSTGNHTFDATFWNECATNFVYPQGGTWVYDRAGWCPGAIVSTFDHEITPYVTPGLPASFDYSIEAAAAWGPYGNYVLHTQLICYEAPAAQYDVAIAEVKAPSNDIQYSRFNPTCGNPVITIQNQGSTPLTSCSIEFGVEGFAPFAPGLPCWYRWEGELGIGESEDVELPLFNWSNLDPTNPVFYATVSEPNFHTDTNDSNNTIRQPFILPPRYENGLTLQFRTDNQAYQNSYTIKNAAGDIVVAESGFSNNTTYEHEWDLAQGCYVLEFTDTGDDGLWWWANSAAGSAPGTSNWPRLKTLEGTVLKTFDHDFGDNIYHYFTIGYTLGELFEGIECQDITNIETPETTTTIIEVYPNPTKEQIQIGVNFAQAQNISIQIYNAMGQRITQRQYEQVQSNTYQFNLPQQTGIYYVNINTANKTYTKQVLVVN